MIATQTITAIIIDDEKQSRNALKDQLNTYCPQVQLLAEAGSVKESVELINSQKPELVFLDIELSDGNGFQVLKEVLWKNFKIIFITAYNQHAVTAFKFNALDYILKPINPSELIDAVDKAFESIQYESISMQLQNLQRNISSEGKNKKLVLKDSESVYLVKISDIIMCEADGAYTRFYTAGNKQILVSKGLKEYEELLLPYNFLRTHHSHLINIDKIIQYDKSEGGVLIMDENLTAPVSQRKRDQLLQIINTL